MICFYHQNKNGICIDRCLGSDGILELPEEIDGQPVTELASYIFSEGLDEDDRQSYLKNDRIYSEEGTADPNKYPDIAGNRLAELYLPSRLRKIGRYAFYNCFQLKKISFQGNLKDLGAGALTGCHRMEYIHVKTDEKGESCLRDFLTELPETLLVEIEQNGSRARFWFPEFFEEGVENTPARILENHVHGSGIRYRNSFLHRTLNILEYDKLFPYAVAWEQAEVVLKLALDRLLYPVGLTETAQEKYREYLKEHMEEAFLYLGKIKAYTDMAEIIRSLKPDRVQIEKVLEKAQQQGDSRWVSILMNELGTHGRKKRKAFEL